MSEFFPVGKINLSPSVGVGEGFDGCISDISIGGNGESDVIGDLASAVIHASNVVECDEDDVGCGGDKWVKECLGTIHKGRPRPH